MFSFDLRYYLVLTYIASMDLTRIIVKGKDKKRVNIVNVLEQKATLELSVRFRELVKPLLFSVRRGSQDEDSEDEVEFEGRKGWVNNNGRMLTSYLCMVNLFLHVVLYRSRECPAVSYSYVENLAFEIFFCWAPAKIYTNARLSMKNYSVLLCITKVTHVHFTD